MVEELKKGNVRSRAGHSHVWCVLCALLRVGVHMRLLTKAFLALVTSHPCPLSPQRRLVSTAPSRMRMMTAPTTTRWRETPVSSPTPLSVCRRIKVSRGCPAGHAQPRIWIRVTTSTVPPVPALSLCCAPGQGQLQAAPPCPPCSVTQVGDTACPMNCQGWNVAPPERHLQIRASPQLPWAGIAARSCSPLVWLGVTEL